MNIDYPTLDNLIGCYFHQDWQTEADTVDAVLDVYLEEYSAEYPPRLLAELRVLLQHSDSEIKEELEKMGCEYSPEGDKTNFREWLKRMEIKINHRVKLNKI